MVPYVAGKYIDCDATQAQVNDAWGIERCVAGLLSDNFSQSLLCTSLSWCHCCASLAWRAPRQTPLSRGRRAAC